MNFYSPKPLETSSSRFHQETRNLGKKMSCAVSFKRLNNNVILLHSWNNYPLNFVSVIRLLQLLSSGQYEHHFTNYEVVASSWVTYVWIFSVFHHFSFHHNYVLSFFWLFKLPRVIHDDMNDDTFVEKGLNHFFLQQTISERRCGFVFCLFIFCEDCGFVQMQFKMFTNANV